jgi:hypothetical protein
VVSAKTLVQGRQSEQIRRCLQRGSGAFATLKHGGCVVTKGGGCGFPYVEVLGEDVMVGDHTSQFQDGVRDSPRRVRKRDWLLSNSQREVLAREDWSRRYQRKMNEAASSCIWSQGLWSGGLGGVPGSI